MSRDVLADAARKHAHVLPGHILLAAEPAAIPASTLTLDLLVEQAEDLDAAQKYALRGMLNGIDTAEDLQLFLGLDCADTRRTIAGLLEAEYIDYRPPEGGGARRLSLLGTGRDAARDAQLRRPKPASIQVVYDRLTGRLTGWRKKALTRAAMAKADEGRILLPPASSRGVQLEDLAVAQLSAALEFRREAVRVLGIAGVTENRNYYYNAILLVYKDTDSNTLRLGVDIDGDWTEAHATALDSIGAVDRLGLSAAPPDTPYEPVPDSDKGGTRLSRDEVIAIQKAFTDEEETQADSAVLDRAQIRWLGVYEHPQWLDEALTNSQRRLLIISPWITRSVVTEQWVRRVERLSRTADVTIFWGFGDNAKSHASALADLHDAARRSQRLAIVKVEDTHAKVLVSDTYYIKTSFNWLSFRGDRSRSYRQEEGDLVQDQELADLQYDRYMTENCRRALEVVGTLPVKYRPLVTTAAPGAEAPPAPVAPTPTAGRSATNTDAATPAKGTRPSRRNPRKTASRPRGETRKEALAKITVGQTMSGVVKNITDYGAFVNLGDDVTGLIHVSQLSRRRIGHPTEVVNVDDSVMVTVLNVDLDAERVSLKLKTGDRTQPS